MPKNYQLTNLTDPQIATLAGQLKSGAIGVMLSDTIYGIYTSALIDTAVEKIYELRKRSKDKPMIILISSLTDLKIFDIKLGDKQLTFLESIWPNPVSVVLPCLGDKFVYLHRSTKTLAFRIPNHPFLQKLLPLSGPLVAPSANFEGEAPPLTIDDTKKYFDDTVDFYIDAGKLESEPSTVIEFQGDSINILRQGSFTLPSKQLPDSYHN
jgi:L-threonylcarbamoyladenylate synthase